MQANQQNLDSGAEASADYVITADNGDDTENYMDVGMASSGYNYPGFSAFKPNTGYIVSTGSDLRLIAGKYGANSSNLSNTTDMVFVAGSLLDTEERMRIKAATGNVILSNSANPTDNGQKLQVVGDADISANATVGGTIVIEGAAYSNAANITALNQLATKAYVDNATAAGLHIHEPVLVATTGNLVAVYSNGVNGVGATLTNNATQETVIIDNVTLSANNRVLVWQQSNAVQNGVYVVTDTGSNSTTTTDTGSNNTNNNNVTGGSGSSSTPGSSLSNPYPWGQCTWGVWEYFGGSIPTYAGNAGDWVVYANSGPAVGTIAVFPPGNQGAGGVGHVAVVTAVNGDKLTVSETNFSGPNGGGLGIRTTREVSAAGVSFIRP